jgi:hypothetical protein
MRSSEFGDPVAKWLGRPPHRSGRNLRVREFAGLSAGCADDVVMIAFTEAVLEAHDAIAEFDFSGKATRYEETEGAPNSGVAHREPFELDQEVCTYWVLRWPRVLRKVLRIASLCKLRFR